MILFVVDQVAGAEYIFPLLHKWQEVVHNAWLVICSPVSGSFLKKHAIDCTVMDTPTAQEVKKIIDQYRPVKAILSSSGNSQLEDLFMLELKSRKIPAYQFIDCWVNYSKRYERINSKGETCKFYPDKILTIDQKAKDEMIVEDIPGELIEIVGQPYFEYRLSSVNEGITKKTYGAALLVTQPISRYYVDQLGYDEKSFVKVFMDVWKALNKDWTKLTILVHPAENCDWYEEFVSQYSSKIRILRGNIYDLRGYSLVVGMFSSMMIQSLLAGVDTVSLQPKATGKDMSFLSRHGYIRRFTTSEDYYEFMKIYTGCTDKDSNMVNKLKSSLRGSCARLENLILNSSVEGQNE